MRPAHSPTARLHGALAAVAFALVAFALVACADPAAPPPARDVHDAGLAPVFSQSGAALAPGVIVAAGGGSEGNSGDQGAWSYLLYKELIANGDVTGDGVVRVAVLSASNETNWLPNYFVWIGQTLGAQVVATNYKVATRKVANSANTVGAVANADVVFIKGGDQGVYYDQWNGTLLETHIRTVAGRGGALGGTSAGAMSLSEYSFSGSKDLVSSDVLTDARTTFLDDASQPGTSGIHTDFLGSVAGVVFDTHFTGRGRLGRLLGILARANDDSPAADTLAGIGLEERTGVVIRGSVAEVRGIGEVAFVRQTASTVRHRTAGRPLVYSALQLDRLTHGWRFNLAARAVELASAPGGVVPVPPPGARASNSGALSMAGTTETDKNTLQWVAAYFPGDYSLAQTVASPFVRDGAGFMDAGNSTTRGDKHETLFRALYDRPESLGLLGYPGGTISRTAADPDRLSFGGTSAAIVIDPSTASHMGLSPYVSNRASSGGTLRTAAFVGATAHVLAESASRGMRYDTRTHQIVP